MGVKGAQELLPKLARVAATEDSAGAEGVATGVTAGFTLEVALDVAPAVGRALGLTKAGNSTSMAVDEALLPVPKGSRVGHPAVVTIRSSGKAKRKDWRMGVMANLLTA